MRILSGETRINGSSGEGIWISRVSGGRITWNDDDDILDVLGLDSREQGAARLSLPAARLATSGPSATQLATSGPSAARLAL
ncbi:hypothetical protein Tco_1145280 [Tanacetum coccineum]